MQGETEKELLRLIKNYLSEQTRRWKITLMDKNVRNPIQMSRGQRGASLSNVLYTNVVFATT